jgi:hypothetical protein
VSLQNAPTRRAQSARASTQYIELELDIDFDAPEPEAQPVLAPAPAPAEPQSVKAAIIKWLDSRC